MRVSDLQGQLPSFRHQYDERGIRPTAAYVVAQLTAAQEDLGLDARTTYGESSSSGCVWGEWLTFCVKVCASAQHCRKHFHTCHPVSACHASARLVCMTLFLPTISSISLPCARWIVCLNYPLSFLNLQYRDLPHNTQLSLSLYEVGEGVPLAPVGGTTMPLFNKKGRLKTGPQRLRVWEDKQACTAWRTSTPGKVTFFRGGSAELKEERESLYMCGGGRRHA